MLDLSENIDSLTNFKRGTAKYLKRLRKSGQPVVLTVNGKAEVVVQDAPAYQKLLNAVARAEREDILAAVQAGIADVEAGRTKPARAVLAALAKKYGFAPTGK
jgi:prevent-host-death family protein